MKKAPGPKPKGKAPKPAAKGPPSNARLILENLEDIQPRIVEPPKAVLWAPRTLYKQGFQGAAYSVRLLDEGQEKEFILKRYYLKPRDDLSLKTKGFYREGIHSSYIRVAPSLSDGVISCALGELFRKKTPCVPRTYGFWLNEKGTYILQELLEPGYFDRLEKAWEDAGLKKTFAPAQAPRPRSGVEPQAQEAAVVLKGEGRAFREIPELQRSQEAREKTLAVGTFYMVQALAEAQNYRFCHYDLHSGNIMSRSTEGLAMRPLWDGRRWLVLENVPFLPVMIDFGQATLSVVNVEKNPYLPVVVEARAPSAMDREAGFDPYIDLVRYASNLFPLAGDFSDFFLRTFYPQTEDPLSLYEFSKRHQRLFPTRHSVYKNYILSPAQLLPLLGDYLLEKGWAREYPTGPNPPIYSQVYPWKPSQAPAYQSESGAIDYRNREVQAGGRTYSLAVACLRQDPNYRFELSCCGSPLEIEAISRPGPVAAINGTFFNVKTRFPTQKTVFQGETVGGGARTYVVENPEEKFSEVNPLPERTWYVEMDEKGFRLLPRDESRGESKGFSTTTPLLHEGRPLFAEEEMDDVSTFDEKGRIVQAYRYRCIHKSKVASLANRVSGSGPRKLPFDPEDFKYSVFFPDPDGGPATVSCQRIPPGTLFHLAQDNPRSFLAWNEEAVYFGAVAGRVEEFPGATILDLYDILGVVPEIFGNSLPITEAVNLDGGRSSELIVTTERGEVISSRGVAEGMALGNSLLYCPRVNPWGLEKTGDFAPTKLSFLEPPGGSRKPSFAPTNVVFAGDKSKEKKWKESKTAVLKMPELAAEENPKKATKEKKKFPGKKQK